jgi:hypothetical protein
LLVNREAERIQSNRLRGAEVAGGEVERHQLVVIEACLVVRAFSRYPCRRIVANMRRSVDEALELDPSIRQCLPLGLKAIRVTVLQRKLCFPEVREDALRDDGRRLAGSVQESRTSENAREREIVVH